MRYTHRRLITIFTAAALASSALVLSVMLSPAGEDIALAVPILSPEPDPAPRIDPERELFITDPAVVDDPVRTTCSSPDPSSCGVWSFGHLMAAMAGTHDHAAVSDFTMQWLETWTEKQAVNGQIIGARPAMASRIIEPWLRAGGGVYMGRGLDFSRAPFRLLAIVNRMDLRQGDRYGGGFRSAGEARFVFGVLDPETGAPLPFTVIFEYQLQADTCDEVMLWAEQWHALGQTGYDRAELATLTERFAGFRATRQGRSSIAQVRSNEIALAPIWQLREFVRECDGTPHEAETFAPEPGAACRLVPTTVKQSPANFLRHVDLAGPDGADLHAWMAANQDAIRAGTHVIPDRFASGAPFLGAFDNADFDTFDPINLPPEWRDLRNNIALQSCSGCHTVETGTVFLHVQPRQPGQPASLSNFVTEFDLPRRVEDFAEVLASSCEKALGAAGTLEARPSSTGGRVH